MRTLHHFFGVCILLLFVSVSVANTASMTAADHEMQPSCAAPDGYVVASGSSDEHQFNNGRLEFCLARHATLRGCATWGTAAQFVKQRSGRLDAKYVGLGRSYGAYEDLVLYYTLPENK